MKINSANLTKKQAFWLFVCGMFGVFVLGPLIFRPGNDVVTDLALIFIGLIVACLAVGRVRRLEKKMPRVPRKD